MSNQYQVAPPLNSFGNFLNLILIVLISIVLILLRKIKEKIG